MSSNKKLMSLLQKLYQVLEEEKRVLIANEAYALEEIVEKKINYLNELQEYQGQVDAEDETLLKWVEKIDAIQETNLLLTKQAQSYQNALLQAISKEGASKKHSTYSASGSIKEENEIRIVDQSV